MPNKNPKKVLSKTIKSIHELGGFTAIHFTFTYI